MLQIVASPTDNSKGIIYDHNMFIAQANGQNVTSYLSDTGKDKLVFVPDKHFRPSLKFRVRPKACPQNWPPWLLYFDSFQPYSKMLDTAENASQGPTP
jgi:hypothetical protein